MSRNIAPHCDEMSEMSEYEEALADWNAREATAEEAIPLIGHLYRDKAVTVVIHGRALFNKDAIGLLKAHRFARRIGGTNISIRDTFPILQALAANPLFQSAAVPLHVLPPMFNR